MAEESIEIPASEWITFLDDFTRQHRGSPVRVEVQGWQGAVQVEAHDIPLQGISFDDRGSERDVNVIMGDERNPGLTHMVPGARRLRIERAGGGDDMLVVEAADGSRTIVRVRAAHRTA